MKELNLYGYSFIDANIKTLEMVFSSLSDDIENHTGMMEDEDWVNDQESAKAIFASFAVAVRRNADQIDKVSVRLKEIAEQTLNKENSTLNEEIGCTNNYKLQMQYANFR